MMHGPINIIF